MTAAGVGEGIITGVLNVSIELNNKLGICFISESGHSGGDTLSHIVEVKRKLSLVAIMKTK